MEQIDIRQILSNDVNLRQNISRKTFIETFSDSNTKEDMDKYLLEKLSIKKLLTELEDKNSEFYFAYQDDVIIGYLKLNFGLSQTELRVNNALEIERIYVLKAYHGKNIGQHLYNKAIEVAHKKNVEYIWLGVWEKNLRAIAFYKKNGFTEFDKHIFTLGDDEQTDIMMKLQIDKSKQQ